MKPHNLLMEKEKGLVEIPDLGLGRASTISIKKYIYEIVTMEAKGNYYFIDDVQDKVVQVIAISVKLVSASRKLLTEWRIPFGYSIVVATTNATKGGNIVNLETEQGFLTKVKYLEIEYDVSYIYINSIANNNPACSQLAILGLWKEHGIRNFSLPFIDSIINRNLGKMYRLKLSFYVFLKGFHTYYVA
ncbi:hypothetical protein SUGI_0261510 [Cryptomeria japonica]|nr:hypothetical protein SUGI_0261510 [Cryptomeria japonica]